MAALTLFPEGRIDSTNAPAFEKKALEAIQANPGVKIKRKVAPEKAHKREPRYLGFPFVAQAFLSLNNPQTPSFANGASLVSPLPLIERHKQHINQAPGY